MNVFAKYTSKETFDKLVVLKTIPELLDKVKNEYGNLNAVNLLPGNVTYLDLIHDVKVVESKIQSLNIKEQTNIGLYANNNYNFVKTSLGIMAYNCVATLIPIQYNQNDIYDSIIKFDLTCLFYDKEYEDRIQYAKDKLPNFNFILIGNYELEEKEYSLNILESNPACIIMTGGSSGRNKGAVLSHRALLRGTLNGTYGQKEVFNQVYYSIMPLTHVFGFVRNLLTSLYTGSTISFCKNMMRMFRDMQNVKPTVLVIVPALAEMFYNLIKQHGLKMIGNNCQTMICGGASVPPYLVTEYHKLGINFCPGYGLTELSNLVTGNPDGDINPYSVGFLFPEQEVKLCNNELWIKGTNLMIGYYNDPEENKQSFCDGWFKTGDLVRIDEKGYFYIIGRLKDIIVLPNGENVSPSHLESIINELETVQESLVYEDVENDKYILTVEILPHDIKLKELNITNYQLYFENEIKKINMQLKTYEIISRIIIRKEEFPRTDDKKIIRPKKGL